mmetsp:Transcript_12539/g.21029  ORF Transcript_12539/g.21029 Transcript_12539/m.21029 type:complete len:217 (-) Transcript_12539:773-1423(-)
MTAHVYAREPSTRTTSSLLCHNECGGEWLGIGHVVAACVRLEVSQHHVDKSGGHGSVAIEPLAQCSQHALVVGIMRAALARKRGEASALLRHPHVHVCVEELFLVRKVRLVHLEKAEQGFAVSHRGEPVERLLACLVLGVEGIHHDTGRRCERHDDDVADLCVGLRRCRGRGVAARLAPRLAAVWATAPCLAVKTAYSLHLLRRELPLEARFPPAA